MSHVCINWDPFNQIRQHTALSLATLFWKCPVKIVKIYDLQPPSVKWYCNHDRGSEGLLHHLRCNTLDNTLQCQQKSIKNWKQKLIIWNDISLLKHQSFWTVVYIYSSFFGLFF